MMSHAAESLDALRRSESLRFSRRREGNPAAPVRDGRGSNDARAWARDLLGARQKKKFDAVTVRLDTPDEVDHSRNGSMLAFVVGEQAAHR
jgi:hypothetical protein